MQEKLNAWQEAANRVREVTSIMNKSLYTAPELLDGLRARLIVALIAVADALGVKLVPDFSNMVVRQDGVPLEVETFPREVVIVSQSRANLIEEKVRLVAVYHVTAVSAALCADGIADDIERVERHIRKNGDRLGDDIVESIERIIAVANLIRREPRGDV